MTRQSAQRGFTLLEIILALGLIAVLGLTLYGSMSVGYHARERAYAQTQASRDASIVLDLIAQDLQSVLPPNVTTDDAGQIVDQGLAGPFLGQPGGSSANPADLLEFSIVGRDPAAEGTVFEEGVRQVQLLLRTDQTPPVLVRRVQRNLLAPTVPEPEDEILARNVRAFAVRYFDGLTWTSQWDSTQQDNTLPFAIEVMIDFDRPARGDPSRPHRVRQIIPLACGTLQTTETQDATGESE